MAEWLHWIMMMWVFPKIVLPQNIYGENLVQNPMNKWMIWGFSPHFLVQHPMWSSFSQRCCASGQSSCGRLFCQAGVTCEILSAWCGNRRNGLRSERRPGPRFPINRIDPMWAKPVFLQCLQEWLILMVNLISIGNQNPIPVGKYIIYLFSLL